MPNNQLARIDPEHEALIANEVTDRANEVVLQLRGLKSDLVRTALIMGDLLLEVWQNNYHIILGFEDREAWLKQSGLDMGISQAYYLMRLVSKTTAVGIERSQLELCDMSALKEIIVLNPDTQADEIRECVEYAKTHSGVDVKKKVNGIRKEQGHDIYVLKGFRIPEIVLDEIINPAIEMMKMEYGQVIDSETNEVIEMSDGKAFEMICAEYMSGKVGQ